MYWVVEISYFGTNLLNFCTATANAHLLLICTGERRNCARAQKKAEIPTKLKTRCSKVLCFFFFVFFFYLNFIRQEERHAV